MAFRDLTDVLGATRAKVLPIHGREVAFPGTISAWAGQLLLAIRRATEESAAAGSSQVDTATLVMSSGLATEQDALQLERELLGDGAAVLDELGVIGDARVRVVGTLTVWHLSGQEAAELAWEGKAQDPPNRATRRRTAGSSSPTAGTARARSKAGAGASSGRRTTARRGTSS